MTMSANLRSLQVLRALAATSVVYSHIGAWPTFGTFGVDIFFIISGFVMALVIGGGQGPGVFAISRVARVVPLYWVMTTGLLVLAFIKPELLNSTTADLGNYLRSLFFLPYFKENGQLHPMLAVGWTLNYEMFFYLCIWVSLLLARRWWMTSALLLLGAAWGLGTLSGQPVAHAFLGNSLLFEFALGFLAFRLYRQGLVRRLGTWPAALLALASYGFMAWAEAGGLAVDRALLYGVPSLVLVLAVTALEKSRVMHEGRVAAWLGSVGDASYATYLSHFFVVEGMRKIVHERLGWLDPHSPVGVVVILLLALVAGHVLYVALDRPLSKYCRRRLQALLPPRQPPQAGLAGGGNA